VTRPARDDHVTEREAMTATELFARLTDELPVMEPVAPVAFLEDELLPRALTPVEPAAFALACAQAVWGLHGPLN
jgi:hypothetical protein